jgi:hypothetical protein
VADGSSCCKTAEALPDGIVPLEFSTSASNRLGASKIDGTQKIRPLLTAAGRDVVVPSADGLSLNPYTGADSDILDINGELSKLAFNISLGHGIHAGIHFRSSTFWSILLGEQITLSILNDRARSYAEPFTITITKFDGTLAKISNE